MATMDDVSERLEDFKQSGLIAEYELLVVDDGVRVRVIAPPTQDLAAVKSFLVDTFAGVLSPSQIAVEQR